MIDYKRLCYCMLILILFFISSCQRLDEKIDELAKSNTIESEGVGFAGTKSSQYSLFEEISDIASNDELKYYYNYHDSAAVRYYTSLELVNRRVVSPCDAFVYHFSKNDVVNTFQGCLFGSNDIASEFYYWYRGEKSKYIELANGECEVEIIDDKYLRCMDEVILYNSEDTWLLHYAITNRENKSKKIKNRIAFLAINELKYPAIKYIVNNDHSLSVNEKANLILKAIDNEETEYVRNELLKLKNSFLNTLELDGSI